MQHFDAVPCEPMQALLYYLVLPLIYIVSYLPFGVLYRISDVMRFLLFSVAGYRNEVIATNLARSFPDKSEAEREDIQRAFQEWFCDLTVETIKTLTIGERSLRQRVDFEGQDLFRRFAEKNQSIIIVLGHFGNWELAGARYSLEKGLPQLYVIYHPLNNRYFDRLLYRMRTRLGTKLYTMKETSRSMLRDRELNTATAFIADQTPSPDRAHWMEFLNQDTPVFMGTEMLSRKLGYPIVYLSVTRPRRGRYRMKAVLLVEDPKSTSQGEITEKHTRRLESDIKDSPDIWLWSHRRWKHKRPSKA